MTREEIIKHLHKALNSVDITFPYRYVLVEAIEALSQPSLPSNLEEAAEEYTRSEYSSPCAFGGENIEEWVSRIFIAGAEWQKEKDTRDMYMSDNRHFEKVYELGKKDMKAKMMEKAVECDVIAPIYEGNDVWSTEIKIHGRYEPGDKVKVIIVK